MHVVTKGRIDEFVAGRPDAKSSLNDWYRIAKQARWRNLIDVRRDFRHADGGVKVASGREVTVFNIGGNKYRLVTALHYDRGRLFVLRLMTHALYTKGRWKQEL